MLCESRIIQVPPGKHVRKSCDMQIPSGKRDLDGLDNGNQRHNFSILIPRKNK